MAGLQRSAISFRRQGSSGLVWDDKLLSGESQNSVHKFHSGELLRSRRNRETGVIEPEEVQIRPIRTSRTGGRLGSSVAELKLVACGCCGGIPKSPRSNRKHRTR